QQIDRLSTKADGTSAVTNTGGQLGLAEDLNNLFAEFQTLSTNPSSVAERQVLIQKALSLTNQFNQVMTRLNDLKGGLNSSIDDDVTNANQLIGNIAELNGQIASLELMSHGKANDLRDQRQALIEELSQYVNVDTVDNGNGTVDLSIDGQAIVTGAVVT